MELGKVNKLYNELSQHFHCEFKNNTIEIGHEFIIYLDNLTLKLNDVSITKQILEEQSLIQHIINKYDK